MRLVRLVRIVDIKCMASTLQELIRLNRATVVLWGSAEPRDIADVQYLLRAVAATGAKNALALRDPMCLPRADFADVQIEAREYGFDTVVPGIDNYPHRHKASFAPHQQCVLIDRTTSEFQKYLDEDETFIGVEIRGDSAIELALRNGHYKVHASKRLLNNPKFKRCLDAILMNNNKESV